MSRLVLTISILVVVLVACGSSPTRPLPEPAQPSVSAAPSPAVSPAATPRLSGGPSPSTPAPVATPEPTDAPAPVVFTADEQYLVDGIRRGAIDCHAVPDDLPTDAVAGIKCRSDDPAVARIGIYLFTSDETMLDAYFARMDAEGVRRDSGDCIDDRGEGAYIPYEGQSPDRRGCFVNAEGYANYRATISGNHVYIGILGQTAKIRALDDFIWRGNQDVPAFPTLWVQPHA